MPRRAGPLLLLAILGVLALGAAALALVQAPHGADLAIHNATGEVVGSTGFTATIVTSGTGSAATSTPVVTETVDYRSPSHAVVTLLPSGSVPGGTQSLTAAQVASFLTSITSITGHDGWTSSGSHFTNVEPVASLVPRGEAALVSGAIRLSAVVNGRYLVHLVESVDVTIAGQRQQSQVTFDVHQVDGRPV